MFEMCFFLWQMWIFSLIYNIHAFPFTHIKKSYVFLFKCSSSNPFNSIICPNTQPSVNNDKSTLQSLLSVQMCTQDPPKHTIEWTNMTRYNGKRNILNSLQIDKKYPDFHRYLNVGQGHVV